MERDPHISKLIRESGVLSAPADFTARVMEKIEAVPVSKSYKPLIGKGGLVLFLLFVVGVVAISIIYTEPGAPLFDFSGKISEINWELPSFHLNLDFLRQRSFSTVMVSAVVAIFILVLTDALLTRRRLSQ